MYQFIFTTVLILLSSTAHAITIEKGGDGKPLPDGAVIAPMVSILDAVDTSGLFTPDPTFIPTRKFNYYYQPLNAHIKWQFEHDCAATLIGTNEDKKLSYLLTSAHCVMDLEQTPNTIDAPNDKRIVVGNLWCSPDAGTTCQAPTSTLANNVYTVNKIIVNNNFVHPTSYTQRDIAIMVVDGLLQLNGKPIKPMYIGSSSDDWAQNQSLYAAGWGSTNETQYANYMINNNNKIPAVTAQPKFTPLNSLPHTICQNLINSIMGNNDYHIEQGTSICSGVQAASSNSTAASPCYGDSGGPMFHADTPPANWNSDTQFTLVGNVSWSPVLCQPISCSAVAISPIYQPPSKTGQKKPPVVVNTCSKSNIPKPSPTIYGFPGGVLCQQGALTSPDWLVNDQPYANPKANSLTATTLNKAIPGFKPNCR